jgi:hypothetical protein
MICMMFSYVNNIDEFYHPRYQHPYHNRCRNHNYCHPVRGCNDVTTDRKYVICVETYQRIGNNSYLPAASN